MFYTLYNYTKLLSWLGIFFIDYKIYKKCNLDILNIVLYNIQNTSILGTKCIQKIIPYLKMSDCDEDIINILNKTYENNPFHDFDHTKDIFLKDFGRNINEKYKVFNIDSNQTKLKNKHNI